MTERLFEPAPGRPEETSRARGESQVVPPGPLRRVMLLVAYDGGSYRGFAPQKDRSVPTVGGSLAAALSKMARQDVSLTCAGRTDAGVHALGQVVHADLPAEVVERWLAGEPAGAGGELPRLAKSLTGQCGPAIVVGRARLAPPGFDARRSALSRRYRYALLSSKTPDPLARHTSWHVPDELDLSAMRIASDGLLGEHDFAAFCRRPPDHEGPINRRVTDVSWKREGSLLVFEIEATAFCHHMVRSIVGCLVAVGRSRMTAADVVSLLRGGARVGGAEPAPPEGLCLIRVRYPEDLVEGGVFSLE